MELSENTFFEIHEYLKGNGDPAARAEFERRMQADPDLAREVQSQKRIQSGLQANAYKKMFGDIHAQLEATGMLAYTGPSLPSKTIRNTSEDTDPRKTLWPYFAAAASVLLALGITWYFHWSPRSRPQIAVHHEIPAPADSASAAPLAKNNSTEKPIASKHVKSPKFSRNTSEKLFAGNFKVLENIETPFSREKYGLSPGAVAQWRSDTATLHQAVRLLGEGHSESAVEALKKVENSRFQNLKYHSGWYIALAFLRLDQREKCREQLSGITADHANPYRQKAGRLLEQLE